MTDVAGDSAAEVDQEFLPLRALAYVLVTLLAGGVVLAVAALVVPLYISGYLGRHAENTVRDLAHAGLVATVILFLVWFRRARINAERSSWRQRRARAWAFWGWLIPIGNLWIPFQLMGDIWRAGLPPERRTSTAWLPAVWWVSWLLTGAGSARYGPHLPHSWLALCMYGIASLTVIAIIRIVSSGPVGEP